MHGVSKLLNFIVFFISNCSNRISRNKIVTDVPEDTEPPKTVPRIDNIMTKFHNVKNNKNPDGSEVQPLSLRERVSARMCPVRDQPKPHKAQLKAFLADKDPSVVTISFASKLLTILSFLVVLGAMAFVNFVVEDISDEARSMWMCVGVAIVCFLVMRLV